MYEFKITYTTDEGKCQLLYCPFCGSIIENENDLDSDLENE